MARSLNSIEIKTTEFEFSHGTKPRGRGNWAFEFLRSGTWSEPWWVQGGDRTYTDALRAAKKHAQAIGADAIRVCP